jgi:hypothetical protein
MVGRSRHVNGCRLKIVSAARTLSTDIVFVNQRFTRYNETNRQLFVVISESTDAWKPSNTT